MASPSQTLVFCTSAPLVSAGAWHWQSRRFLECVDHFLLQVIAPLIVCSSMLHLVVTNKEGLVRNVKLLGFSGCEMRCQESRFWPGGLWDKKPRREEGPKKTG